MGLATPIVSQLDRGRYEGRYYRVHSQLNVQKAPCIDSQNLKQQATSFNFHGSDSFRMMKNDGMKSTERNQGCDSLVIAINHGRKKNPMTGAMCDIRLILNPKPCKSCMALGTLCIGDRGTSYLSHMHSLKCQQPKP